MIPRLPSHAPPFPQPAFTLGGGCREGGSPPDFPSCPAALPAGAGRFPHCYRNPQSRPVRTHRPSRFSNLGTAEIASFEAPDVCEAKPSARPRPTGPGPKEGRRRKSSPFFRKAGPSRKRTASVSGTARQRAYSVSSSSPPVKQNRVPDTAEMSTRNLRPPRRKRRL